MRAKALNKGNLNTFPERNTKSHTTMTPPLDQVAYLFCLLLSFPLSQFYWKYMVPRKGLRIQKQLFFAIFGHIFLFILFLPNYHHSMQNQEHPLRWLWHVYIPTLFSYIWCWLYRGKRWMPYVNLAGVMGYCTYLHWCRYQWMYGEYRLDHITVIMLLVIKLSSFGFDINDAFCKRPPVHGKKPAVPVQDSSDPRLAPLKNNYYPSLLEFLAYSFMYAGVLTGPAVFFPEFKSFLDGTFFTFPHSSNSQNTETAVATVLDKATLAGRKKRALSLFLQAVFFIACNLFLSDIFPPSQLITPAFANVPWYRKFVTVHITNFAWRTRYYLAWLLAESSHVILGLGYKCTLHTDADSNVTTVHHTWDRLEVVDPIKVEGGNTFRDTLTDWHKTTNIWLYRYVYLRCGFLHNTKRGKPGFRANLLTKFVSALWHGIYPGYYVTFGLAALYTWVSHLAYRHLTWPESIPRKYYYWVSLLCNYILSDYVIATFELLPFQDCLAFYRACGYYGHIAIIGGILMIKLVIQPIKAKQHVQ